MRESLESIARSPHPTPSQLEETRSRICAAVDELRGLGWTPERIIIRIKEVATEVFPGRSEGRQLVIDNAVRWTVEHYYRRS